MQDTKERPPIHLTDRPRITDQVTGNYHDSSYIQNRIRHHEAKHPPMKNNYVARQWDLSGISITQTNTGIRFLDDDSEFFS